MRFFLTSDLSDNTMVVRVLITTLAMFLIGCMLGYGLEVLFRRFVSAKKWVNPGFMKGPWLPLYGFGLTLMFYLCWLFVCLLPDSMPLYNPLGGLYGREAVSGPTVYDLIPISAMGLGLILLEFVAGLIFVKGFKVRLWDYTNMKGNILGIICPVFNLIWLGIAVLYYYGLDPFVYQAFQSLFDFFFGGGSNGVAHFGTIFLLGVVYGVFLIDLVQSIGLFSKVSRLAKQSGLVERYEKLREESKKHTQAARDRFYESLPEIIKKGKEDSKAKEIGSKIHDKVRQAILIDPTLKGQEKNYDADGRPIKEDK